MKQKIIFSHDGATMSVMELPEYARSVIFVTAGVRHTLDRVWSSDECYAVLEFDIQYINYFWYRSVSPHFHNRRQRSSPHSAL